MIKKEITKRKRFGFTLITLGLAILISLLVGEIVIRSKSPVNIFDFTKPSVANRPELEWAFIHPFHAYIPKPGKFMKKGKTVNQYGFISTPKMTSIAKPDGRIRIVFLGGSSTAGTGRNLVDEQTWPYKVWLNLKESYPDLDIEMINAAVSGYSTFESFGRLWSQVRFFEPDIVMVYHGWNDMYYFDDASAEKIIHWRFKGGENWGEETVEVPPKLKHRPLDQWLGWSHIYGTYRLAKAGPEMTQGQGEFGGRVKLDKELATTFDPKGVDVFISNLKLIENLSIEIGAEFYVIKQATLMTSDLPKELRGKCYTWYHTFNYQAHLDAFSAIYSAIDKNFQKNRVINAAGLSGNPKFFIDHIHPSPAGCDALAQLISTILIERSEKLK